MLKFLFELIYESAISWIILFAIVAVGVIINDFVKKYKRSIVDEKLKYILKQSNESIISLLNEKAETTLLEYENEEANKILNDFKERINSLLLSDDGVDCSKWMMKLSNQNYMLVRLGWYTQKYNYGVYKDIYAMLQVIYRKEDIR